MRYRFLKPISYEPKNPQGRTILKREFIPGQMVDLPGDTPTALPIEWLLAIGAIEPVVDNTGR